jgi:hypothetical protein
MKHNVRVARNSSVFPMAHGECVYIVDIDSTILDIKHRVHHVQKEEPDWTRFFPRWEKRSGYCHAPAVSF